MNFDIMRRISIAAFSNDYQEARQKFLSAVPGARPYPSAAKGPSGDDLFTDVSYFGPSDAKKLLVLVSGTHGVEGYCGSAAQLLFIESKLHEQLPPSTAVLIVHALNCYGFAWDRRVTAEGVDLNRNFVDFAKPLPQNVGYEALSDHVVPADLSDEGLRCAEAAIEAYKTTHGQAAYMQARMGGQYTRPGGLFYGGTAPTEARLTLERIVTEFEVAAREQVIIVDYHTGLGPYGYGEVQCEQPSGIDGYERAVKAFGQSVTSPDFGTSSSVFIPGCVDAFWERELADRHIYVALEFGTIPGRMVLRDDHWLFKYRPEEADTDLGRSIRRATKDYFYPEFPDWKEMVLWRSHQVHRQAIEALS